MPCYQYKGRKYTAIELLKFIKQDEQRFLSDNNLNVGKWRYEVPDSELKVTFDEAMEMLNNGKGEMLLSDMIDDKELFDSYPKLKDTKIYLYGKGLFDNTGGTADASQNYISIGLSGSNNQPYLRGVRPESMAVFAYDNTSLQSVLSHEVQHLIQFNEGFNGGGTVEGVLDHLTEDTLRGFQETGELAHLDPETKKAVARSRTIQKYGDKNTAYRSLSGEVESRNVQTRMNMTPEERLNTLLSETEDVSREDQIVLMDGFGVSNLEGDHQQLANDIDETFNYQNEIVITDKDGAADMFKGVLPADVVNNIRNGNWEGGFTVRGKIIIHSGLKHPGSILSVLVHEKSHIQIRRVIARESDRIKYFSDVFTRIAPNELKRVIGTDYSEDPEHVQAEEYYVHLTEELAFKGELPESVDDQTKKHIFDILNGFTTLKNIQDVINTKIRNGSNGGRIQSDTRGKGNVAQRNTSKNKMDTGTSEALPESGGVFRKGSVDRSIPLTDVLAQAKQSVLAKKSDVSLGEKPNDMTNPEYWKGKTVTYLHSPEPSPYMGSKFGQDVEPAGKYITIGHQLVPQGYTEGQVTFKNPLVIDVTGQNYPQWKIELSKKYNATGKKLTNKLLKEGYDSIITVEEYKGKYDTSETIILNPEIDSEKGKREKAQPANTILINGVSRSTLNSNGKPDSKLVYQDLLSRIGKKKFTDYLNENGLSEEEIQDALTGNDEYWIDQYLSDEYQVSVNSDGYVQFEELTPQVKKLIGNNKVLLYHHTSDAIINSISKDGIISTGANVNRNSYRNLGVYLTAEYSGNAVEGYKNRAWNFHGGNPITLEVSTTVDHLKPDDNDSDLKSGRSQFVVDKVKPEDIINLSEFKPKNTITINGVEKSTLNSNGKPIANSEEGIRNFYRWFQNSKVVDAEGRPLVVYHGTLNSFDEFIPTKGINGKLLNRGTASWFSPHGEVGRNYAGKTGSVIEAYIKITNPKIAKSYIEIGTINSDKIAEYKSEGYDGAYFNPDLSNRFLSKENEEYVTFSPSQIKSATGNNGSFSPDDNNILFKRTKLVIDILADAKAGNKLDKDTKTILNAADRNNAKPIEKRTLTQKLQAFRDITQEKDAPVWRWISALKKQGATIKDEDNPFLLMKLAPGRMQTLFEEFEKEYINPLIEIGARIEKAIGKNNFIEPYLIALHAPERNASTRADKLEEWRNKDFNLENWIATENAQRVKLNAKELTEDEIKEKIDEQHELGNYKTEKEVEAKRKELDQMDFSGILPMNKDEKGNVVDEQFENDPDALARSIVNGFEGIVPAELVEELKAARKKLTDKVLQNEVEANKLTRKQADEYKAKWENYIPLRGWKDAAEKHFVYNQTNNGAGSIIKHAGGRGSMAESPLGYIYKMGYQSTNDKVQGEIKEALLRMAMANLDNDLESMFEVKQAYFKKTGEVDIDGQEVWTATTDKPTKQELENGTVVAKRYTGHMKNRAFYQSVEHEVLVENPNGGTIVFVFDKTNPDLLEVAQSFNHMNMMMRIAGGKANSAETLNNIIQFRIPWINMSVRDLTNLNKAMLTQFNLQFIATNTPRDFTESNFDSYIVNGKPISLKTNKQAVKAIDQYLRGVDDTTGLRDMLLSFYEMGGTTGHTRTRTPEEYQKDIFEKISKLKKNGLKKGSKQIVSEWLTRWNQRAEDGVRFSVFMNEIRNGKTPQMAAFRSRNATVDFNIRGKLSPVLGFMWGFFEVSANALAKTGDYMAGKGSTIGISVRDPKIQRRALKSAAFMMMLGFVDALLNDMLLGGDDDDENDYYNRSRWMRHNYLNIPIPNSKLYVPIPLPPGWRAFKGFGAVMYDYLLGQRGKLDLDDAAWQSVQNFIDGYSPVPITQVYNSEKEEWQLWTLYTPMLLKPISEVAHNQNYMGLQITKEPFTKAQEELLANHSLSKENTGIAARYFADLMWKMGGGETQYNFKFDEKGERVKISPAYDWNPSKISHIIGGYGGGTFTFVGNIMTTAQRLIDPNEEIDLKHVPFVTAILKKTGDSKWNTIREYYSLQDDIKGMSELSGEYMKRIISKEKGAVKNYVNIQGSQYLQNYKAILENNDNIIKDLSEQVNYQTGEGEEKVIEQMKSTIKSIDELKKKYNKK